MRCVLLHVNHLCNISSSQQDHYTSTSFSGTNLRPALENPGTSKTHPMAYYEDDSRFTPQEPPSPRYIPLRDDPELSQKAFDEILEGRGSQSRALVKAIPPPPRVDDIGPVIEAPDPPSAPAPKERSSRRAPARSRERSTHRKRSKSRRPGRPRPSRSSSPEAYNTANRDRFVRASSRSREQAHDLPVHDSQRRHRSRAPGGGSQYHELSLALPVPEAGHRGGHQFDLPVRARSRRHHDGEDEFRGETREVRGRRHRDG